MMEANQAGEALMSSEFSESSLDGDVFRFQLGVIFFLPASLQLTLSGYTRVRKVLVPFLVPQEQYLFTTTGQQEPF